MPEEKTDVNKEQNVAAQGVSQPATGDGVAQVTTEKEGQAVPYDRFKEVNDAKKVAEDAQKAAEASVQTLADQMAIMQANQQQVVQAPAQPLTPYDQAKADLGLVDEEFITEADRSKIFARTTEIQNAQYQRQAQRQTNLQFAQTHSDYGDVVGRYIGNQFQPSPELTKILTEKPHLTATAFASSEGAYKIVMEQRELEKLQAQNVVNEEHLKQQGVDDKIAPVSAAAAAGGAVTTQGASVTVEQQEDMERRVEAGEFQKG